MPFYIGPQKWWLDLKSTGIVTNGLVLNLDAGNPASYSGIGTTWTDLSCNGNDGTLLNGVSYDSANGGSLVFDGSNYIDITNLSDFEFGTGDYTIDCWFKLNTVNGGYQQPYTQAYDSYSKYLQIRFGDSGFSGRFQCGVNMASFNGCWSTTYTQSDLVSQYKHAVFKRESGVCSLWLDGSQQFLNKEFNPGSGYTFTDETSVSLTDYIHLGDGLVGNIYSTKVYNRALTQQEVTQNYNALKGRYEV